eukprot:CAMPEP_0184694944 /NCGR_PEP_ID=MMETSP0313-20130426/2734_1 /TAXON_ID=2792 /ORGANISM="Porphyridium aerugineum, Strain SAG 1380-2" /LENGTH=501 /DNA_ID=CAMNT_0027153311 /DNA_START=8 /DNA_END=1513 /DNA_ORIENTATION=+
MSDLGFAFSLRPTSGFTASTSWRWWNSQTQTQTSHLVQIHVPQVRRHEARFCMVASASEGSSSKREKKDKDAAIAEKSGAQSILKDTVEVSVLNGIEKISPDDWDALVGSHGSPFMLHDWIRCLEKSGCATGNTGWQPYHIVVRESREEVGDSVPPRILAACPVYVKNHSQGEFVFDQQWADVAYRAGIAYFPKLLVGVPFTPASGQRIITAAFLSKEDRASLVQLVGHSLKEVARSLNCSSIHVNFCEEDEVELLSSINYVHRVGVQYHFKNENFNSFDDYLGKFRSKKRIKIKRERKSVYEDSAITIKVLSGDEIPEPLFAHMFYIYVSTIEKMFWGRQYLNEQFFRMLGETETLKKHLCFILAYKPSSQTGKIDILQPIAGTFNVVKDGRFYGRYWGAFEEVRNLHFETCYYKSIEHVIDRKLQTMEPGAGGGEFKFMRGFEPTITHSMHFCLDQRLHDFVRRYASMEAEHIQAEISGMQEESAIRAKDGRDSSTDSD